MASPYVLNEYTKADVAKHNTKDDLWVIIDGQVYDVTTFFDDHPGGGEVFLEHAGGDASSAFHAEPAHESDRTTGYQGDYLIGKMGPKTVIKPNAKTVVKHLDEDEDEVSMSGGGTPRLLLMAVLLAIVAVVYQFVLKK